MTVKEMKPAEDTIEPTVAASGEEAKKRYISTEELRRHTSPTDLWISIQGKVYDVTSWVDHHPGGSLPLLCLAGQDVTDAFVAYHPGTAWRLLDRYYIGHYTDYRVSAVSKDYRRMVAEFSKMGMFEEKGHGVFFSICFMLCLLAVSVYLAVATTSPWAHLASAAVMGFLWIQSGWVGHDAGHYNVMISPAFNRVAELVMGNCMTGISIGWWKYNHNAHHLACNSLDYDPDLQHIPLFAVSNSFFQTLTSSFYKRKLTFGAASRFFISYQHWTYYPVMCFARLNLYAQSLILLFSNKKVPNRVQELLGIGMFWVWYSLFLSCLPNWSERLAYILVSFSLTGLQHVQFTLNHWSTDVYVGQPKGNDWFEKQTAGTLDIKCPPWMDWFHGGLQFQVEHHLFPRLPRCHLRAISPLVMDLCKKHGLRYRAAYFLEANRMTLRTLRAAAMQARDLSNPLPRNLVWEALNTHG